MSSIIATTSRNLPGNGLGTQSTPVAGSGSSQSVRLGIQDNPSAATPKLDFLGTIAGNQTYTESIAKNKRTYTRFYEAFGGSNELRATLTKAYESEGYKKIGEDYSYTPPHLRDGRPFGTRRTWRQGGGFFLITKKLQEEQANLNNFIYILENYKEQLEQIAEIPMQEILLQVQAYGINYIVHQYFDCIDHPKEGDLVVYQSSYSGRTSTGIDLKQQVAVHAGIYRESEPNWNSPSGGTVESKWQMLNMPYVFQHDVFFVPDFFGDSAQFYRLKQQPVTALARDSIPVCREPIAPMHEVLGDGRLRFTRTTKSHAQIRQEIDTIFGTTLIGRFPQIQLLGHIEFVGVCYDYALGKILKTYTADTIQGQPYEIVKKYFTITTQPKAGDLAVYAEPGKMPLHYGIYCSNGLIESKWGHGHVYRHPPFYVPNEYGDSIIYYRLKPGAYTNLKNRELDKEAP